MEIGKMAQGVASADRRALAQAITLVESTRADHRAWANQLLATLGTGRQALRLGLSGTPGVGKSTFIESFGLYLINQGLRVAVLAIDPSSARSGGSILGDKTRMEQLSRHPSAFIRPSPSQAHMGGVARRTREAVQLCEAAGYDVIIIETVGVGQSETMVAEMCDIFVLLMAPAGGDELQGVKRGIMEKADLILVNKADGDLEPAAHRTVSDYAGALHLLRARPQDPDGFPKAMPVSAYSGKGLDLAWQDICRLSQWRKDHGHWQDARAHQASYWFDQEVRHGVLAILNQEPTKSIRLGLAAQVFAGEKSSQAAASEMLALLGRSFG